MRDKKHEAVFIPCGDSFEKMSEISDEQLEQVTGGCANSQAGEDDGSAFINSTTFQNSRREN